MIRSESVVNLRNDSNWLRKQKMRMFGVKIFSVIVMRRLPVYHIHFMAKASIPDQILKIVRTNKVDLENIKMAS